MGADEKSILKKCGEILINIKARNKKSKIYTFNCAFCGVNCDQLKKFSLHIDEKHLQEISEEESEVKTVIYVPEIKTEELNNLETKHEIQETVALPLYEDPLETIDPVVKDIESADVTMELEIKEEEIKDPDFEMDFEDNDFNRDDIDYPDCPEDNDDEDVYSESESSGSEYKAKTKNMSLRKRKKVKISEKKNGIKSKRKEDTSVKPKKRLKKSEDKDIDEKELFIALLEAFEKQTILWKLKERTKFNSVAQKYFEIVANEVNEKLKCNITWATAKIRIRKLQKEYSEEIEKKNKGEDYKLPWYSEHIKFLQENVEALLKGRDFVKKYHPLKTMDESEFSILIDVYKKSESLWQVTNIGFGAKRKKLQEFGKIAEELNSKHNINVTADTLHSRVSYMLRIYSENKRLQLQSELEKRNFQPSTVLYEKMSFLSESQGPFKCSQCNEIIERYGDYREHLGKCNDTIPFTCEQCQRSFYKHKLYLGHVRRHLELNYHFCKYCDRGFSSTCELKLHERSHTGENPYLCQVCGATFKAGNSYDNHIRRHENRFRYECHICNHGFNHLQPLNDHVKAHLNIRDIVCNVCGKTFTSKKRLKNHQYIHSEKKRYKCKVCGKEFTQDAGLRQHFKQHQPLKAQRKKEPSLNFNNVSIDFFKQ